MAPEAYRLKVTGIVQGVGFRPFIYNLAISLRLNGWVGNTGDGVTIEAEGPKTALDAFVVRVKSEAPPLSLVRDISIEQIEFKGYTDFKIEKSSAGNGRNTFISPDIGICDDCRRELFDINDRRYLYPFINCTNCGPRFTIIRDIPYDRPNTTMDDFSMCPSCRDEYNDPSNRRYHAQPVSCRSCGPELSLLDSGGGAIMCGNGMDVINTAGNLLAGGRILAIKGLGGYHLACDASDTEAVGRLRKRKHRDEKPFALMAKDIKTVLKYCIAGDEEKRLLQSAGKPIVLLEKKPDCPLPEAIAPRNRYLGIMLPYTPLHLLLFHSGGAEGCTCPDILVMTSGNRSSEPICYDDRTALEQLHGIADYFLAYDRLIHVRNDDSVTRVFRGREYVIRRSRGYAPAPVIIKRGVLPEKAPHVLACGGELKNTFCLGKDNEFYSSHHIGDLENLETLQSFEEGIGHYTRLFGISPQIAAYDMHPEYLSTKYALSCPIHEKIPVQHHHAHVASCMAENGLTGNVIGIAFDGTGFGEDGNIWGSEFFTGTYGNFKRAGHLEYVKMPGGEAAVREPWRMAVSYMDNAGMALKDFYGRHTGGAGKVILGDIDINRLEIVQRLLKSGFNSPLTSGMGRLFDAVSALTGVRSINNFEGQAAMELEYAAAGEPCRAYGYEVTETGNVYVIGVRRTFTEIFDDVIKGLPAGVISSGFHETAACMVEDVCRRIRGVSGLDRVVLSGGVFQNMLLLGKCMDKLAASGFEVFIHSRVPANDGGISLGQAVTAVAMYAKG